MAIHATVCSSETLMAYAHCFVRIPLLLFRVLTVLLFTLLSPKELQYAIHETAI
jgi:hypothetical protein